MEILFFLGILVLQFAYQIHLAIKKKKARQQIREEKNLSETQDSFEESPELETEARYESFEEPTDPSQVNYANYADASHGGSNGSDRDEDSEIKNFYNQLFGFTENNVEPWTSNPSSPKTKPVFTYDAPIEETPVVEARTEKTRPIQTRETEEMVLSKTFPKSTPSRIRDQLRNPRTQRDAWRIKFILDTPPGLSTNRDLL